MPEKFREKLERVIVEKDAISRATYGQPLQTEGLLESYLELAALHQRIHHRYGGAAKSRD